MNLKMTMAMHAIHLDLDTYLCSTGQSFDELVDDYGLCMQYTLDVYLCSMEQRFNELEDDYGYAYNTP